LPLQRGKEERELSPIREKWKGWGGEGWDGGERGGAEAVGAA